MANIRLMGNWNFPFYQYDGSTKRLKKSTNGSIEIKSTELVTQEVYKSMLIYQLIPVILRKWLSEGPFIIFIQQDNTEVYITNDLVTTQ